jgi:hypothetical protein
VKSSIPRGSAAGIFILSRPVSTGPLFRYFRPPPPFKRGYKTGVWEQYRRGLSVEPDGGDLTERIKRMGQQPYRREGVQKLRVFRVIDYLTARYALFGRFLVIRSYTALAMKMTIAEEKTGIILAKQLFCVLLLLFEVDRKNHCREAAAALPWMPASP